MEKQTKTDIVSNIILFLVVMFLAGAATLGAWQEKQINSLNNNDHNNMEINYACESSKTIESVPKD